MGILKTDIISHSQLPDGNQSVEFDGTGDYLQVPASAAWRLGAANQKHKSVTIEWWIYLNSLSSHTTFGLNALSGLIAYGTSGRYAIYAGGQALINESNSVLDAVGLNEWHHYALVLHGGAANATKTVEFYRDGKLSVSNTYAGNVAVGDSTHVLTIGVDQENNSGYLNGFISNFRWSDEVVYKTEFTVPKFKLKARSSTMLLCCQSSTSVTEAAVSVSGSVTSNGDPAVSAFGPGLKDDITDTGVVFDGVTTFDSQAYMVPPGGNTRERNRGRGLAGGGWNNPSLLAQIYSVEIQSDGTSADFGDLTDARRGTGAVASHTRAVWGGGYSPGYVNVMDFVTIANSADALDFGDLDNGRFESSGVSNDTRGVFGPCENPAVTQNVIQFITIATTGNAQDFGDSTVQTKKQASMCSNTRGLFAGGQNVPSPSAYYDIIDKITIATTGNAADFGDLTQNVFMCTGVSDSTRGIRGGGATPSPANTDTIDFVTIASDGNATDFGNLTTANQRSGGMSNRTRGLFSGGATPNSSTSVNSIDKITIQTTGNAVDFGDYIGTAVTQAAGCSDSHGGLS